MPETGSFRRRAAMWSAGLLLTSALGACNSDPAPAPTGSTDAVAAPVALPLSTATPATLASAPPVTALPAVQPVRVSRPHDRRQGYRYLDRGLYQEDAVQDAPPDYSFDDDGVRPWTWASGDGARVISEPVAGGYRTYYYDAGSDAPYLVRDPRYAYAYDNGALVAVFTVAGAQIDLTEGSDMAQFGGRYYSRGHALWGRATSGPHLPVNAYAWSDRRADLSAQRVQWQRHIADNPDWSAWNSAHQAEEQAPWSDVRAQHQQAAQQFGTWQQQHFHGSPPQLYGAEGAAPPQRDHTAAVVGGVVAAGIVAGAVHGLTGHHEPPHPTMGPAVRKPEPQNPGIVPVGRQPEPGRPGTPPMTAPVAPATRPHPAEPVKPGYQRPIPAPVAPAPGVHVPAPAEPDRQRPGPVPVAPVPHPHAPQPTVPPHPRPEPAPTPPAARPRGPAPTVPPLHAPVPAPAISVPRPHVAPPAPPAVQSHVPVAHPAPVRPEPPAHPIPPVAKPTPPAAHDESHNRERPHGEK